MRTSTITIVAALLVVGSPRSLAAQVLHRDSIPTLYSLLSAATIRFGHSAGADVEMNGRCTANNGGHL